MRFENKRGAGGGASAVLEGEKSWNKKMSEKNCFYNCSECGSPLMPTATGSVCPNGHGRIKPPLPKKQQHRNCWLIEGLPEIRESAQGKTLHGLPVRVTEIVRSERRKRELQAAGFRLAIDGLRLLHVTQVDD
jgi:hypothetical protein